MGTTKKEVKNTEKLLKHMSADEISIKQRAARTLYNVGWHIDDIAEALEMIDNEIRELIKMKIVG